METYHVSCEKNNTTTNSSVRITKHIRLILVSNCGASGKKKSRFVKN